MTAASAEDGAGSVLAIAVAGTVVAVIAMTLPLYSALSARQAVSAAADAAALAAADVAVGLLPGYPCDVAASVALANGGVLALCELDGLVATVSVKREFMGFSLVSSATAGPPGESQD